MVIGSAQLVRAIHRHFGRPLQEVMRVLSAFWPAVLVCLCWGALTYLSFSAWFAMLDPAIRFSRVTRAYPGVVAVALYVACLASLLAVEILRGALTRREAALMAGIFKRRG
jgi:hypothetical protein